MSSPPVGVTPGTSLREAAGRMASRQSAVLACDEGGLHGILTDRDLVVRAMAAGLGPHTPVREVMSAPVLTIGTGADLAQVYGTFRRNNIRRLPVVTGTTPVGMLTVDDPLRDATQRLTDLLGPISWSALREDRPSPKPQAPGRPQQPDPDSEGRRIAGQ
ncbi:CBS domain-containing protein [Streptomyces sp. NBC_01750]|uniref:CBS domain-containing protein n=1 Tax=Streptomyces sp. NBC_01750 TaxID=2975928 RepID=UPI002DD8C1AC|nr:CBS domain-containing protein [Streptomyces sp. NBC_01750]WSD31308.1 CBS domain-containing protein [Streptomyces sp. NBC_01750]